MQSAVWPADNLEAFARARAQQHSLKADEYWDSLLLHAAAEKWSPHLMISSSPSLLYRRPEWRDGGYRDLAVMDPTEAEQLMAMWLRSRGLGIIPHEAYKTVGVLQLWWTYRLAAMGALPEILQVWLVSHSARVELPDEGRSGAVVSPGSLIYTQAPGETILGRFSNALRARDRVFWAILSGDGNEADERAAYEGEMVMLQLSGALDEAARALASLTGFGSHYVKEGVPRSHPNFQDRSLRAAIRNRWNLEANQTTRWNKASQMVKVIRNRIHSQPTAMARYAGTGVGKGIGDGMRLALPQVELEKVNELAKGLDGSDDWGLFADGSIDPWVFMDKAVGTVKDCLAEMIRAQMAAGEMRAGVDATERPWPWNTDTTRAVASMFRV